MMNTQSSMNQTAAINSNNSNTQRILVRNSFKNTFAFKSIYNLLILALIFNKHKKKQHLYSLIIPTI